LRGKDRSIVESFISAGHRDFFFIDRMHPGRMYLGKYDSCKDDSFLKFILIKANDSDKYEFLKYDDCGLTRVIAASNALRFFEENRDQINRDTIEEGIYISHTIFYSLYEFKDGQLESYIHFCKECVDWDRDEAVKGRNQSLSVYRFFNMLDVELMALIESER
jgi:hypothetical protein